MGIKHTILLGWPVLSVLLIFSIICVAIFMECWSLLGRCHDLAASGSRGKIQELLAIVEQRLAVLGTIANAAPFVGLLGTVIGIIRAFHTIARSTGQGGLTLVAGGISEALVSTAAGLAVAIPASMLYNYFTYKSQRVAKESHVE